MTGQREFGYAGVANDDGYAGPARLVTATEQLDVTVVLAGFFQPVDGFYHWHGRVTGLSLQPLAGWRHDAVLVTPHGLGRCEVLEPDLWGRFKVTGRGRPPFPVLTRLPE